MKILTVLFFMFILLADMPAYAQSGQGSSCAEKKPFNTDIEFNVEIPDPYYKLDMGRDDVNKEGQATIKAWLKKNNMQGVWAANDLRTEGYASGGAAMLFEMGMAAAPYDVFGAVFCPFFKKIEIDFMFRTMIVIPSDYQNNSCKFSVINAHELRHYYANKSAVESYIKQLKRDMPSIIAQIENDPVSRDQVEGKFKDMQQAVKDLIQVYFIQGIGSKMQELNGQIDSPEEYETRGLLEHDCEGQ